MTDITYRIGLGRNLSASEVDGNFSNLNQNKVETSVFASLQASVEGLAAISGVSAGTTQLNEGTVVFGNSNGVSWGLNGSTLTASVKTDYLTTGALSNHTHGNPTLSLVNLSGATASASNGFTLSLTAASANPAFAVSGVGSSASSGTVVFSNSNGVSFGMNGSTMTASHNGLTTAALSNHSHGNPTLALTNLTGATASNSAGLTLSLSADMPQPGIAASAGTQSASNGTVVFANSNGVSFGMSASSQITASHNGLTSQSGQAVSAGNGSSAFQTLGFADGNGVSWSTGVGGLLASVKTDYLTTARASNDAVGLNTALTANGVSATINSSGLSLNFPAFLTTAAQSNHSHGNPTLALTNLAGSTASGSNGFTLSLSALPPDGFVAAIAGTQTATSGSISFANSNGISFGMLGSSQITASYTVPSTAGLLSAIKISAGLSSSNVSAVTFSNANGVSFGYDGTVVTASVAAVAGAQTALSGLANSQTTFSSGTVGLSELGAITIRSTTGNQFQFSVAPQSAQTQSNVQGISAGTQVGRSGDIVFSNSNGISFGLSGSNTLTASYTVPGATVFSNSNNVSFGLNGSTVTATATFAQSAQTQSNVQGLIVSNTTYRTGDVSFSNANGISFGSSAGQAITASYTVPGATVFSNSNNVSFGLNGSTVTATATFAQSNQVLSIFASSNTTAQSSSGTIDARSLSFRGMGVASVGLSAGEVVISVPGAAGDGGNVMAAGTRTAQTSGTVIFSNANGISFGLNAVGGSQLTASYTVPSTAGLLSAINISGGTTSGNVSAVTFSNGNGVSFGFDGSVMTASVAAVAGAQTGVSGIANSQTTFTSGTVGLLELGAITIRSTTGNQFQLSVNAQTNQAIAIFASSQTYGQSSSSTVDARSLSIVGSGGVSVGMSGGSLLISGQTTAAQSNQTLGLFATGNTTQNSSSAFDARSVTFNGLGAATVGFSNGSVQISAPVQTVQSQSNVQGIAVSDTTFRTGDVAFKNANGISFGSSGANGVSASYTVPGATVFSNSNNVSFGLNGSTVTATATFAQSAQAIGIFASSQTFGQSSSSTVDARSLSIVGSGGVSVGMSAGSLLISGQTTVAQSAQTQSNVQGLIVSNTTYRTGDVSFSNANGISFGSSAGQAITASYTVPSTAGLLSAVNLSAGTTSNNLSAFVFSNSNGLSFGLSGSTVTGAYTVPGATVFSNSNNVSFGLNGSTITATATLVQSAQSVGIYASSQTYGQSSSSSLDARSLSFVGSGGISIGLSGGSILISGQTTAGATVFSNSNNVSFGLNGSTVTASATFAQTNQAIGLYASSQTYGQSSSSTVDARSLSVVGSGGVSVGMSAGSLLISGQTTAAQTVQTIGVYASSQTYGQSSSSNFDARSLSIVGSGAISVGLSAGSILISAPATLAATVFSNSNNVSFGLNGSTVTATATFAQSNQTIGIFASSQTFGQSSSSAVDARSLSVVGSGGISVGMSAGSLLISGQTTIAQSNQTQSNVQGIAVSNSTFRTGDVSFSNLNGISFGSNGANVITASYTVPAIPGATVFSNSNNVSFGLNGSTVTATATFAQSAQTQNVVVPTAGTQTATSGTIAFANSNGISFGMSGGSQITASYTVPNVPAQTAQTVGFYASSQTYGQSSSSTFDARSLNLVGSGGISVGLSGGSVLISGPNSQGVTVFSNSNNVSFGLNGSTVTATATFAQSNQIISAFAVSNTTQSTAGGIDGRSLSFAGAGGVSVGVSNGSVVISGGAGGGGVAISAGTQSVSTGSMIFANSNGVSFGMSGSSQITASFNGLTTARASNDAVGLNTAQTNVTWTVNSSGLSFNAAGYAGIGFSSTTTTGTAIVATNNTAGLSLAFPAIITNALTTARASNDAVGLNTAQTNVSWTVNSSGISLNAAGYAGTGTSVTGNAVVTLNSSGLQFNGVGLAGTSTGFTGVNISASMTHNSAGLALSMSVAAPGGGGGGVVIAASNTTYTSGTVSMMAGSGAITIGSDTGQRINFSVPQTSSLVGANGINISTNGSTVSIYQPLISYNAQLPYLVNTQTQQAIQNTSVVFPFQVREQMSAGFARMPHTISLASTSFGSTGNTSYSYNQQETHNLVIYSLGTGASSQSLMSFSSASVSFRFSVQVSQNTTNNISVTHGITYPVSNGTSSLSFSYAATNSTVQVSTTHMTALSGVKLWDTQFGLSLPTGRFWMAYGMSTTQTTQQTAALSNARMLHSQLGISQPNNTIGLFGQANTASIAWQQGLGSYSNAGATTANINLSQISSSASHVAPYVQFINQA